MNVKNAEMINKVIDPDLEKRDILESEIPRDVLDILLKDRTTGENIKWMTDSYEHLESTFDIKMGIHDSIDADTISRPGNKIIRPRVDKSKEEQRARVQKKAEVFTPSWICNNMNNLIDAAWFERKTSPFTVEGHKSWRATRKPIVFPKKLKKTWLDFVTEVRLEITCGEAPFLVSRYDTTTGEIIPIPERIGILDRNQVFGFKFGDKFIIGDEFAFTVAQGQTDQINTSGENAGRFRIGFKSAPVIAEDAGIVVGKRDGLVEVISIQSRNHTQTGQGLETVADTDDKFAVINKFLQLIAQIEFDSVGENGSGTQVVAERESADEAEQVVLLKFVFSGQKIVEVDKFGIGTGEGTGCGGFAFAVETESGDNESFDFFVHGIKCDNLR